MLGKQSAFAEAVIDLLLVDVAEVGEQPWSERLEQQRNPTVHQSQPFRLPDPQHEHDTESQIAASQCDRHETTKAPKRSLDPSG